MYKLKYEKRAKKFLKGLDFSVKIRIDKALDNLKYKPYPNNKKHILDTSKVSLLCELSVDKYRIYYTIEDGFIVIENISYQGIVRLIEGHANHKSGSKNNWSNQRRDIKRLIKWFKSIFK